MKVEIDPILDEERKRAIREKRKFRGQQKIVILPEIEIKKITWDGLMTIKFSDRFYKIENLDRF